jgi:hypothetical protein
MNNEDKLIKELLKEGFYTKAPDNFTANVMEALADEEKSNIKEFSPYIYGLIFLVVFAVLSGVLYYTNNSIFVNYGNYFLELTSGILSPFVAIFTGFRNMDFFPAYNGLFFGVTAIIIVLLGIDYFLKSRRKSVGLFI